MKLSGEILNPLENNNQYNPGPEILDPTGYWRWNVEVQQWIPAQPAPQPDAVLNEQDQGVDEGVDDDGDNPFLATVRTFTMKLVTSNYPDLKFTKPDV